LATKFLDRVVPRAFEPPEELLFNHTVPTTVLGVTERVCSRSYIAIISDADKARLFKDLTDIIEKGDDKVWIDEKEGTFEYPYTYMVVIVRKK
jgi:hypothetical protein